MSTYGFRLRFLLPKGSVISHDSDTLEVQLNSGMQPSILRLVSNNKAVLKESNDLSLCGNGFATEEEASSCGIRARNSLVFCATQLQMGVDCGRDKSTSGFGKVVKDYAKEQGILLLNNVHGLSVYPDGMHVRFGGMKASVTIGRTSAKFTEEFIRAYELSLNFTDKLSLAFELYGASHFEASLRAKLLSLISVVESICVQDKHSKAVLKHLDNLINMTKDSLDDPEKDNIISRLGFLKRESISSACKKLVADNLEEEEVRQFESLYNVRSRILHDGRAPEDVDLGIEVPKLDKIVSKLLIKIAGG